MDRTGFVAMIVAGVMLFSVAVAATFSTADASRRRRWWAVAALEVVAVTCLIAGRLIR